MTTIPQVVVVRVTQAISTFWVPDHIFGVDDANDLVCQLIVRSTTICMLTLRSMGVYSWSCDLLKFGKISVNISEMVQDRDIVTMED